MRLLPLLIAGMAASAIPAFAQTPSAPKYVVAVALSRGGQVVDAPSLTISPGASAQAQVAGRYRIETSLKEAAGQRMTLEATISRPEAEQWVVVARPTLTLNEGGHATMRLASVGWDSVELAIQPEPSL